jgi:hypothetical protein
MRLALITIALATACCVHTKEPPPVPKTGAATDLRVEFAPDVPPEDDQLFICSKREGAFWCIDYELFLEHLAAEQAKGSIQL